MWPGPLAHESDRLPTMLCSPAKERICSYTSQSKPTENGGKNENSSVVSPENILFYRKNSKNWDTLNYHRDCPTNGIVGFYSAILRSKDADRITNRVDTDQTAP